MSIDKVDFEAVCYDNADHILRNKLNQIIDAVTALQEYCMPGFKGEISKCGWCGEEPDLFPRNLEENRWEIKCCSSNCSFSPAFAANNKPTVIQLWNEMNDQP
jgi:hypothetical protein